MKTIVNELEHPENYYNDNYADFMNECIEKLNEENSRDIERVTKDVADEWFRDLEKMSDVDVFEEELWELMYEVRGELVKLYNIWFALIEKEITEHNNDIRATE